VLFWKNEELNVLIFIYLYCYICTGPIGLVYFKKFLYIHTYSYDPASSRSRRGLTDQAQKTLSLSMSFSCIFNAC